MRLRKLELYRRFIIGFGNTQMDEPYSLEIWIKGKKEDLEKIQNVVIQELGKT